MVTHVFDNIDWKNKNLQRTEMHHTNSILVQKYDITEDLAKISLEPKYHFNRKKHRSYKGKHQKLPSVNFKRAKPKLLPYPSHHEQQEYDSMGGFHISICMLRTIYEQFNKCGIIELLSAAGLGGKVPLREI